MVAGVAVLVLALGLLGSTRPRGVAGAVDQRAAWLQEINSLRYGQGIAPLSEDPVLDAVAAQVNDSVVKPGCQYPSSIPPIPYKGSVMQWQTYGYTDGKLLADVDWADSFLHGYLTNPAYSLVGIAYNPDAQCYGPQWTFELFAPSAPIPTPTPSPAPRPTPTPTPSPTPIPTPSTTPTPTPTPTPTAGPTPTPTDSATPVPTDSPTPDPTDSPTPTAEPTPTDTVEPTPTPTPTPAPQLWGDVDCDGVVGSLDALAIVRGVAGLGGQGDCLNLADVDCSGAIDVVDALLVLRYTAGLPVTPATACPPIGQPVPAGS